MVCAARLCHLKGTKRTHWLVFVGDCVSFDLLTRYLHFKFEFHYRFFFCAENQSEVICLVAHNIATTHISVAKKRIILQSNRIEFRYWLCIVFESQLLFYSQKKKVPILDWISRVWHNFYRKKSFNWTQRIPSTLPFNYTRRHSQSCAFVTLGSQRIFQQYANLRPHWIYDFPDLHYSNPIWFSGELSPTKVIYFALVFASCFATKRKERAAFCIYAEWNEQVIRGNDESESGVSLWN